MSPSLDWIGEVGRKGKENEEEMLYYWGRWGGAAVQEGDLLGWPCFQLTDETKALAMGEGKEEKVQG
ncbi:hypothetical protein SLEP1_g36727 [Rubroshorea leprosula]|uniref:Uncharacterized protein n=1 Tax=Rubroshorea leprosula TaxID=152421 RepID=A0AAV5KSG2_9ROSI|nr:hypothetical protein SLEP1_g36727 [Rubroshorea leprosula]